MNSKLIELSKSLQDMNDHFRKFNGLNQCEDRISEIEDKVDGVNKENSMIS